MKKKLKNSNKGFGILFFVVFIIIALWSFRGNYQDIRILPLIIGLIFLALGLTNSKMLTPLKNLWIKFGDLLGRIVSPIVMFFIYFAFISPFAFLIRLLGKDLLNIKFNKSTSYWLKREKNIGTMKRQF